MTPVGADTIVAASSAVEYRGGGMVQRAVHYSRAAAALLTSGHIAADTFKCPAWPDLLPTVLDAHPAYVHFALKAGAGIGDAVDTETGQPADWGRVEALLERTGTPFVNVHLSPTGADLPGMPTDTTAAHDVERVTECLIRDVRAVVARFGAARVIVENDHDNGGLHLRPAYLPGVIGRVVAETGCGFLLDLAHVRLAAHILGTDPHAYGAALPVAAIREVHVSGVQPFGERFVAMLARGGVAPTVMQRYVGRLMDHLPMTEADWAFTGWALDHIRAGRWGQPWVVALEYGGVGPLWEAVTEADVLAAQVPRLHALVGLALS